MAEQLQLFNQANYQQPIGPARLKEVQDRMKDCKGCTLCGSRKQVIVGQGKSEMPVFAFISGEPDTVEDWTGVPIGGAPGQVMDRILKQLQTTREESFLCHVVGCKPEKYRDPTQKELDACRPYLHGQLIAVQPQFIITFGVPAARGVLPLQKKNDKQVEGLYGNWQVFDGRIPVMPSFELAHMVSHRNKVLVEQNELFMRRVLRKIRAKQEEEQDAQDSKESI